jgi:hypothetical protein
LDSSEHREAVWFVQFLSLHAGGLRWAAAEIAPDYLTEDDREKWLARLCLDPGSNNELTAAFPRLRDLMADYARQKGDGVAVTEIGRAVYQALDYCSKSRCLVMISGKPRIGKT